MKPHWRADIRDDLDRVAVPGGWLYRSYRWASAGDDDRLEQQMCASTFVPDPHAEHVANLPADGDDPQAQAMREYMDMLRRSLALQQRYAKAMERIAERLEATP